MTQATLTMTFTDDDRWRALETRDPLADGSFFYGVRTTGVYCRPTCRSRRPNRANVTFFEDTESAERAGYRACRRCRPGPATEEPLQIRLVTRACTVLKDAEDFPSLEDLAAEVGVSAGYLHRSFKKVLGVTPKEFAMTLRSERLREGLSCGKSVAGAIFGAGFGSVARAYEESGEDLGMSPGEYRKGGEGQSICFATAETSLGRVLVAATGRGICSIELGDSAEALKARLVERFPKANLTANDPDFADQIRQVVALVEAPGTGLNLPRDIRGTAFQRQVWEALRAIPAGRTATYAEVARSIGRSSAVRAVAGACAANELAIVIPCHRVIRGDGGLGGYRWGIDRKRALIDREAASGETPS